jgi:hypothetical protein
MPGKVVQMTHRSARIANGVRSVLSPDPLALPETAPPPGPLGKMLYGTVPGHSKPVWSKQTTPAICLPTEVALFPVNELAINLAPKRIYHRYLEVLVVAQALVAEVLGDFFAMPDRFCIRLELDPDGISMRDAVFHIEEKLLHAITSEDTNTVRQVSFRT